MSGPGGGIVFSSIGASTNPVGAADVATSAFFRATQFVSPAAVSAGLHASARSSPATSAVEGAETESYAG